MPANQVLLLFLIQLAIVLLPAAGMYKMFEKAGAPAWKALIPFYNIWVMLGLSGRKRWIFFLQFIPVAGWFITMGFFIDFIKTFGKFKLYQHALAALVPAGYFAWVGFNRRDRFIGTTATYSYKKSAVREWADAAVFAVIAATLIRTFVFESYAIPTGSMEKTMMINDYLFVSKISYGPRLPNTPLALPFVHNSIPFTNLPSYLQWLHIPYTRWFATPVKRNDIVVFNMPEGDTTVNKEEYGTKILYYDLMRSEGNGNANEGRKRILANPEEYPLIVRPVDKQDNYIKRCVAVAGDTLLIRDRVVYINGRAAVFAPKSETYYYVETGGQPLDETAMKEEYDVDMNNAEEFQTTNAINTYRLLLTTDAMNKMKANGLAKHIIAETDEKSTASHVYPFDNIHSWTLDDFGPLWLPAKGAALVLTKENYPVYERAIRTYEGNALTQSGDHFFINGAETDHYTFKMNYYWMMGDNRHNSQDSRIWGMVPEDHIVGKAAFIFMSWDKGIRWNRLLKKIE